MDCRVVNGRWFKRLSVLLILCFTAEAAKADGGSCTYASDIEVAVLEQGEEGLELITAQGPVVIDSQMLQQDLLEPSLLNHYVILQYRHLVKGDCTPQQFVGLQPTPIVEFQPAHQSRIQALVEPILQEQLSKLDGPNTCYRSQLNELMLHWKRVLPELSPAPDMGLMTVCYYLGSSIGDKAHVLLLATDPQGKPVFVTDYYQTQIYH